MPKNILTNLPSPAGTLAACLVQKGDRFAVDEEIPIIMF